MGIVSKCGRIQRLIHRSLWISEYLRYESSDGQFKSRPNTDEKH